MSLIHTEDVLLLAIVTLIGGYQLVSFAKLTGAARRKFKIVYPAVTGNPDFERVYRAQQNTLEFFPIFLCTMWVAGVYFHQIAAAGAGLVYLYGRNKYFSGYTVSVEGRLPGFRLSGKTLYAMLGMSVVGLTHAVLMEYLNINLKVKLLHMYYNKKY
ncbi:hypothetical protein ScPMuIL_011178 [Solemya velum]